jgi:DNA-binding NtrC family response regulator
MAPTPRILIVDDEPQIRAFLCLTFERAGYDVNTAGNGPDAIALCEVEDFDVVLSDVTMPGMSGHQLLQWVSEQRPKIRTALMSGYDVVRGRCAASPVHHLIAKPFQPKEVVSFVGQLLSAS